MPDHIRVDHTACQIHFAFGAIDRGPTLGFDDLVIAHITVAIPERFPVAYADAVHHAIADEPMMTRRIRIDRIGTDP